MDINTYIKINKMKKVENLAMAKAQKSKAKLGITLTEIELRKIALRASKRKGLEF